MTEAGEWVEKTVRENLRNLWRRVNLGDVENSRKRHKEMVDKMRKKYGTQSRGWRKNQDDVTAFQDMFHALLLYINQPNELT